MHANSRSQCSSPRGRAFTSGFAIGIALAACAGTFRLMAQSPDAPYVTVRVERVAPHIEAYGQVEPIAALPVNAGEDGIVAGLRVVPGVRVRAGQALARLTGPAIQTAVQQSQADVRSAQAQLSAAQKYLAIEREQLPSHLSTRASVQQAENASVQAETNLDKARSKLQSVEQMMTAAAPASGTVLAVNAANGERVNAGQPIVTLQTAGQLWVRATYYGADLSLIRAGMAGVFTPADGSTPIAVRVRAVSGAMTAGEGETIGLTPVTSMAKWINGEFGAVALDLPPRNLVAVPTRALILDQGKWWVLVHTGGGNRPQQVIPGPQRGWETFLESGLQPGSQVVVENAYLLFHRGISERYQPPDE